MIKIIDSMNRASIREFKSLPRPPPLILLTVNSLLTLLGEKDITWRGCQKQLSNPMKFIERLRDFQVCQITRSALLRVEDFIRDPDLSIENMCTKSVFASVLYRWVVTIVGYCREYRTVYPFSD